jgi:hypothetical protein
MKAFGYINVTFFFLCLKFSFMVRFVEMMKIWNDRKSREDTKMRGRKRLIFYHVCLVERMEIKYYFVWLRVRNY